MFIWILFSTFISNGAYSVCAPILPVKLVEKNISGAFVGLTFAMYSMGYIFWSPIVSKYLIPNIKPHNLLGSSLVIMGISFACFGTIEHIESETTIMVISCLLRLIQGLAGSTQYTTALCLIARYAKGKEKPKQLGRNTAVWGTSLMSGPIIGSALYAALGFERMFYVYGGAEVFFALILRHGIAKLVLEDEAGDQEELV